jgi:hypothetical protein
MKQYTILIGVCLLTCLVSLSIANGAKAHPRSGLIQKLTKLIDQREEKLLGNLNVFKSIICSMKIRCEVGESTWTSPSMAVFACPKYNLFLRSDECGKRLS